jgi:FAD:protein FMN transferase
MTISGARGLAGAGRLALLGALPLLLVACQPPPRVHVLGGHTMGTGWTVQVALLPDGVSREALHADIENVLELIDGQMSTFRGDSDISRFNGAAAGEAVVVPEDFALVLASALELARDTGGAYDPTVGPLVNLWGFGPDGIRTTAPPQAEIEAARARVGWYRLELDSDRRELIQPGGVYLDLSSIAKGHAVDRIAEHLEASGIDAYLVDIGGDLRVRGVKPDGSPWRIAIERPLAGARAIHSVIAPRDLAVATSGGYRNFFVDRHEDRLRRFSHTIDPRTGYPVEEEIGSITVLHPSAKQADALATALGVLSVDEGFEFARERNLAALFLFELDGEPRELATPQFERAAQAGTR